jgi:hypothetical protein
MGRRAARVDANQAEIIAALRQVGATVHPLHTVGAGCPDILIGYQGRNLLAEIKDGSLAPSDRRLTTVQVFWHETWRGQVAVVTSVDEALALLRLGVVEIPHRWVIS